jgi:hypothetical protein
VLYNIERIQKRFAEPALAMECVEHGDTVRTANDGLSVNGEGTGTERAGGVGDQRIAHGPVIAMACKQANRSLSGRTISR